MQDMKEVIKTHMIEAAGNVMYTYNAHWNIVNRLKKHNKSCTNYSYRTID